METSSKASTSSIRTNLVLWISISLLIVGVVMVFANTRISSIPIKKQLYRRVVVTSSEIAHHLAEDIWNMDDTTIEHYFKTYPWASIGLASVKVTTEYGDILYERQYRDEPILACGKTAVLRGKVIVGHVEVSLNQEHLLATQRAIGRSGLMLIAFAILIIVLVCTFIVNTVVIRPVKNTVSGLRKIADGDYSLTLPSVSTTEIDSLNREINAMVDEISKRQTLLQQAVATRETAEGNLRELNEELEDRIKTRTEQLRRLAKMLTTAQDHEQKRIAEGLHDDVAQMLAACRMKVTVASSHAETDDCKALMAEIDDLVKKAYDHLRLLSFELASSTLYQWGLKDSLVKLCAGMKERFDVSFELVVGDDLGELDDTISTVLFKAARELLFNVVKHSGLKKAFVRLERVDGDVMLTVEDEGKGFGCEVDLGTGRGLGLFSIQERLQDIDGSITIDSEPYKCTCVTLVAPWLEKSGIE